MKVYANGILFNPITIYWSCGIFYGICLGTIAGSTRIITNEPFSIELQLRIIKAHKVTIIENPTNYVIKMVKSGLLKETDLPSLKHIVFVGRKMPSALRQEFNALLPNVNVVNSYGMTELGDVSLDHSKNPTNDSAGRFLNVVAVKIVDEEGNRCGINVAGEICAKGRHKFLGYYKKKELSDEAVDNEGFFKTGDIGRIDENGYLYILDRKKNVLWAYDDHVFPSEIEEFLLKSPEIECVCVVGVRPNDVDRIELPAALVVRAKESNITEKDIHKMIEGIQFL